MRMLLCLLFFLLSLNSIAYSKLDSIITDEVIVSASRVPVLYSETSRVIHVISREEITNSPANSIEDLLKLVPGVDVRSRGVFGVQSDISIRGGTFNQILVLLNGVAVNDPQTGHHNFNLPVSFEDIERIEVLEGTGARVLGSNALSGAINIITTNSSKDNISLKASSGQYNFYNTSIAGNYSIGGLNNHLSISKKGSDGYINNTDFQILNAFYQADINSSIGKFDIQAGYNQKAFGANSFYSAKYPDQYEETNTLFANINMVSDGLIKVNSKLFFRRNQDKFLLKRNEPEFYTNHHLTNISGFQMNSSYNWDEHTSSIGIEIRNEHIYSNNLGLVMDKTVKVPGENAQFTKEDNRNNISFYAEQNFHFNNLDISGGLMINWNSAYDFNDNFGLDMSYKINNSLNLFTSFNKAIRLPTFTDIYYKAPGYKGYLDLKPEKTYSFEGGLKYNTTFFSSILSIFHRNAFDVIDRVLTTIDEEDVWVTNNLTELSTNGFELSSKFNFTKAFGNDFILKTLNISYSFVDVTKTNKDIVTKYIMDFLRHKFVLSLHHKIIENLDMTWYLSYNQRAGSFENINGSETPYPDYLMLDSKIKYKWKDFIIFAEASNILDSKYYDISNILMPGLWIRFGIMYKLGLN